MNIKVEGRNQCHGVVVKSTRTNYTAIYLSGFCTCRKTTDTLSSIQFEVVSF
jgi:hypothetical protein